MPEMIQVGPIQINFLRSKHDTGGGLDLFEATVPAGSGMPVPHHHRDWEETIYGLEGTLAVTVDGARHNVGAGEVLFIPRGAVHAFVNDTAKTSKMLCVLTPGVLGPEFFREMAVLLKDGAPDPAKMGAVMKRHGLIPAPLAPRA